MHDYTQAIKQIKVAILKSRHRVASQANAEMLSLYYGIGEFVSKNTRNKQWGKGAIEVISKRLQQELPGLRGFSATSIKKMRVFYEEWNAVLNRSLPTNENSLESNRSLPANDLKIDEKQLIKFDFQSEITPYFIRIGFTHHYEIISKTQTLEERIFYIKSCANNSWTVESLRHHLKNKLYNQQGNIQHNFDETIKNTTHHKKAIQAFKDELLLDFINIEDADDEIDERVLEQEIVQNIKKFIMALGTDFSLWEISLE